MAKELPDPRVLSMPRPKARKMPAIKQSATLKKNSFLRFLPKVKAKTAIKEKIKVNTNENTSYAFPLPITLTIQSIMFLVLFELLEFC